MERTAGFDLNSGSKARLCQLVPSTTEAEAGLAAATFALSLLRRSWTARLGA